MYSAEEKRSAIKRAAVRVKGNHMVRGHSFSTYARLFLRLAFLAPKHLRSCPYQGVRNVIFWKLLRTY